MQIQKPADLARIVKTRRQSQGYTQQDIADAVGITRQSLARIERGNAGASFDLVLRIFDKLGIRLEANPDYQRPVTAPIPAEVADTPSTTITSVLKNAEKVDASEIAASAYKNFDVSAITAAIAHYIDNSKIAAIDLKISDVSAIAAAATAATRNLDTSALFSNWQAALKGLSEQVGESTAKDGSELSTEEARKALLNAVIEAGNPDLNDSAVTGESSSQETQNGDVHG